MKWYVCAMMSATKKSISVKLTLAMLCLTLSMGCTKKAKTASGDTGTGDAKTAGAGGAAVTDTAAALQKQIDAMNEKIAAGIKPVADDVTKLRTEIENEKKAVLTPVLKQEFWIR
jgi:hypothetical protein